MDSEPDSEDSTVAALFQDPPNFYPPSPKATFVTHRLQLPPTNNNNNTTEELLTLRLVGHNPLWGHHLWNAGRVISHYLEQKPDIVRGKHVLELGAGAGLPSLVSSRLGAAQVIVTDYPDLDLIQNLRVNIEMNCASPAREHARIAAEGYRWGADPTPLLRHLLPPESHAPASTRVTTPPGFDILILADLLFNHSEHRQLLRTMALTLKDAPARPSGRADAPKALVFFTPYRPWLLAQDLAFFDLCRAEGWVVEKVLEEKMDRVMFAEDRGDAELRRTVYGFVVRRGASCAS